MLRQGDGTEFTAGRSRYEDRGATDAPELTGKIFIKIRAGTLPGPLLAQLDTGAAWSVLDAEVAEAMALELGDGEQKTLRTRFGPVNGRLQRVNLEIVADEGDALGVEATVFVSPQWRNGTFLGYGGLLDRVRFAVDPSDNSFHFGRW